MDIGKLVDGVQVLAVVCNQWGDTGKGKIVHLLAPWADINARGTGTNNAGHTFYHNRKRISTHFLSSGIAYDGDGKITILGSGMGIEQEGLLAELAKIENHGLSYNNLQISQDANVIMPYHRLRDRQYTSMDGRSAGTTGKGTGPMYEDFVGRRGIMFRDLFNKDIFVEKVKEALKHYPDLIDKLPSLDEMIETEMVQFETLRQLVRDTKKTMNEALNAGKKVILEGSQGLLLSHDKGTYGHCTSTDVSRYGLAEGVDLRVENIDLTLGAVRAPVINRVGNGPFPTEFGGRRSKDYCNKDSGYANIKDVEIKEYGDDADVLIRDQDEFKQGVGWRMKMDNYGTTTQRPRRVGRLDMVALKYALSINGRDVVLTGVDFANGVGEIEVGVGYRYESDEPFHTAEGTFEKGREFDHFTTDSELLDRCVGVYETLPGWKDMVSDDFVKYIEQTGARVRMISHGPGPEQTIIR